MELTRFTKRGYPANRPLVTHLITDIWTSPRSARIAIEAADGWASDESDRGPYFFVEDALHPFGLTGYSIEHDSRGNLELALRHHGTSKPGTGKNMLGLVVDRAIERFGEGVDLVELIPEHTSGALIPIFSRYGFRIDPNGVPLWERRETGDYYRYAMRASLGQLQRSLTEDA